MSRKPITDMSAWPSLILEGGLIAPAMIAKIDQRAAPEQAPETYSIRKGLRIREEISTAFRVGQFHFDTFTKLSEPSQDATKRFISDFFKETFGFNDLAPELSPVAMSASVRVPIVVVPPSETLDRRSPTLSIDRSRSAAFALQDYLNEKDDALWGIATNGMILRLMRDNASLTRPAYIEADLAQIFANEDFASFAVLWLLIHRSRFGSGGTPATDCALERWRDAGSKEGEVARDRLAGQVQIALKVLGSGFLEANPELATKLNSGEINLTVWFNELLRLIYRLIFLMVAEDRNLLHPEKSKTEARALYVQGYSLTSLRKQCYRAATWDRHHDRYEGLKIVFHALAQGQKALALPALGGLFAEGRLPSLENARLRNKAFMEALYRLSWLSDKNGMVPVNWRAMETEELGSVYETLLELQPQLGDDGKSLVFASDVAEQKGNQRKTTGSYYTPDSLVQALLDTALDPVLDKVEAEADDPAQALLKLSVIDPACGSGHFLLAAARRIATRLARHRAEGTPALSDFRHALRDVARSCIHGVDRNPMAVELTKVALWIETVDPGLPLGFFDAQIRCGDALLGVFDLKVLEDGIPDAAYKPLTGDDKDTAKYYKKANQDAKGGQGGFDFGTGQVAMPEMKPMALDFSGFRDLPEDTVEQIGAKAKRFRELRKKQGFVRATAAANLYVAAFLLPKVGGAPAGPSARTVPTTEELWMALNQGKMRQAMVDAPKATRRARAFHWPLEFPDVMQRGGFDLVLGNPPWEVMQLSEKEYFATAMPSIALMSGAVRKREIEKLKTSHPQIYENYSITKRDFDAGNEFARESGRFSLTARGKVNTYSLFAELFYSLSRQRSGVIIPTGIATNESTAPFFSEIVRKKMLVSLMSYTEIKAWFSGTKDNQSFCLLTLGKSEQARFCFQIEAPEDAEDNNRSFSLTPEQVLAINPNTGTAPVFRSAADAKIVAGIYSRVPILQPDDIQSDLSPWHVNFRQGLFNMTSESELFFSHSHLTSRGFELDENKFVLAQRKEKFLPLFEAKMVSYFDHRWGYYPLGDEDDTRALPRPNEQEKRDPRYDVTPRLWVNSTEVEQRAHSQNWSKSWFMVHRALTNKTNERTYISSLIPKVAIGNSLIVWSFSEGTSCDQIAGIYANSSSLVLDFVVRNKIGGTNLNSFYLKQFPFILPAFYTEPRLAFITPKVLELTYTSHSLAPFACDLGHDGPPFAWDEDRRADLRADLDAFYARAYGLTRDELRYILDPADVKGPDYPSETFRVLKEKEIRTHGEYRTRRLVLAAWDRMEANGEFTKMGM